MRNIYLVLAFLGTVIPYFFFINFIQLEGFNISLFVKSLFVNGAAGGFSADLLIASVAFWLFIFSEKRKDSSMPAPFSFVALNLTIGLSCALPAYFYARYRIVKIIE